MSMWGNLRNAMLNGSRSSTFTQEQADKSMSTLVSTLKAYFSLLVKEYEGGKKPQYAQAMDSVRKLLDEAAKAKQSGPKPDEMQKWFRAYFRTQHEMAVSGLLDAEDAAARKASKQQDEMFRQVMKVWPERTKEIAASITKQQKMQAEHEDFVEEKESRKKKSGGSKSEDEGERAFFARLKEWLQRHPSELEAGIGREGASGVKIGLMGLLGPASPLVHLLDRVVDLEKLTSKALNGVKSLMLWGPRKLAKITMGGVKMLFHKKPEEEREEKSRQNKIVSLMERIYDWLRGKGSKKDGGGHGKGLFGMLAGLLLGGKELLSKMGLASLGFGRGAFGLVKGVFKWIGKQLLLGAWSLIKGIGGRLLGIIGDGLAALVDLFMEGVAALVAAPEILIGVAIAAAIAGVAYLAYKYRKQIKKFAEETWDKIKTGVGKAWNWAKTGVEKAWADTKTEGKTIWKDVKSDYNSIKDWMESKVKNLANGLLNHVKTAWDDVKNFGAGLAHGAVHAAARAGGALVRGTMHAGGYEARAAGAVTSGLGHLVGSKYLINRGHQLTTMGVQADKMAGVLGSEASFRISSAGARGLGKLGLKMPNSTIGDVLLNAASTVGVDPGLLFAEAQAESNFDPNARANSSSASGLFQFVRKTWAGMVSKYGRKYDIGMGDIMNPRANAIMGALLLKQNQDYLARHGVAPNAGNTYLAHFMGAAGAVAFIRAMQQNPNADAAKAFPKQAASNPSIFRRNGQDATLAQVYAQMTGDPRKVSTAKAAAYDKALGISTYGSTPATGSQHVLTNAFRKSAGSVSFPRIPVTPHVPRTTPVQTPVVQKQANTGILVSAKTIPSFITDEGLLMLNTPGLAI